jgi:hypothetical protein
MDYFNMYLHASIASRLWSSFKGTPKLHIGYFKTTLHVDIVIKVTFCDAPPGSLMDSNVNPNGKQWKNKGSMHAPWLAAL